MVEEKNGNQNKNMRCSPAYFVNESGEENLFVIVYFQ